MTEIIFPNTSYFVFFSSNKDFDAEMNLLAKQYRFPVFFCRNLTELENALQRMTQKIGCFAVLDGWPTQEQAKIIKTLNDSRVRCTYLSKDPESLKEAQLICSRLGDRPIRETLSTAFLALNEELIPPGLEDLVVHSANISFSSLFPGVSTFSRLTKPIRKADLQILYFTVDGDTIGLCNLKACIGGMLKQWPELDEKKSINNLKEAANQFLGLVHQNLLKADIRPKIGLPTQIDLRKVPEVHSMLFFPSVQVSDPAETFQLKLGYLDLSNSSLFDLRGIELTSPSEEVEFL